MSAGAKVQFGKTEVYWPQDDDASQKYQKLLGIDAKPAAADQVTVEPTFDARVQANAQLDILVTPEANMGLKVGGGKLLGGTTLIDAQLVGYMNTSLSFQARATGGIGTSGSPFLYSYGLYLYYNLGYGAFATIAGFSNWALKPRDMFSPFPRLTIYENTGSFSGPTNKIRSMASIGQDSILKIRRPRFLGSWSGTKLLSIDHGSTGGYDTLSSDNLKSNLSHSIELSKLFTKRSDDPTPGKSIFSSFFDQNDLTKSFSGRCWIAGLHTTTDLPPGRSGRDHAA
jgi:hypothetical protein